VTPGPADDACTVIVTVDGAPEDMDVLRAHALLGHDRFPDYEGFLGGTLHESADGRLVQLVRWASEHHYRACIDDPTWDDSQSARSFMALVRSGRARMDVRVYRVIASSG